MENQNKMDRFYSWIVIVFLLATIFLIKGYNTKRDIELEKYVATLSHSMQQQNNVIKILSMELKDKQEKSDELQQAIIETRNNLDAITKKLTETTTPPVPAAASVPK